MATFIDCAETLNCATLSGSNNVNVNFQAGSPNKIVVSLSQSVVGLSKLEVTGNTIITDNSSNAALRITQTGAGEAIRVEDSANPDSTPFVVSSAGSVGIGTSNPAAKLEVLGGASNDTTPELRISGSNGWIDFHNSLLEGSYAGLVKEGDKGIIFSEGTSNSGTFIISPWSNGSLYAGLRMDASGNVGIGTVAATGIKLHVASDGNNWIRSQAANGIPLFNTNRSNGTNASPTNVVNGDELGRFDVRGYNNSTFRQAAQISAVCTATPGGSDTAIATSLYFRTSPGGTTIPADRMIITSAGDVGIGTTSPSTELHVNGAITADSIIFGSAGGTGTATGNTLGDYEEGTWTPNFSFSGGTTGIIKTSSGKYLKIGNLVCVSGIITLTNKGTSTGRATVENFPFTSTATERGILQLGETSNFNSVTNYPSLQIAASSTAATFYIFDTAGQLLETNINNNTSFRFSGCYLTT